MSLTIHGNVQGINLRSMIKVKALELGLTGFVTNNSQGTVTVEAEGEKAKLEEILRWFDTNPGGSRVDQVSDQWREASGEFTDFTIKYA
ncbi:MAG: acylphosphatase [bacterium]|nr:acylphosphatase [bacterium]